jgi:hypothetical protein
VREGQERDVRGSRGSNEDTVRGETRQRGRTSRSRGHFEDEISELQLDSEPPCFLLWVKLAG